ncbi:HTH-type transcriptional regulator gltC [uncultured Eubacterium sp.]|nr:HTH-type transcriptional regulator gltC [uncultured Eubacterium sp.]
MELLQLKYFLMLARTEHVSKTAAALHISQPSLSSTIKKLENEVGVPLFTRQGRNIRLSPYGHAYLTYVEQIFTALENGQRTLAVMKGQDDRHLALGILSPYIWKDLLRAFSESHPSVKMDRYSMEGSNHIKALLNGNVDMYLGALNGLSDRNLTSKVLYEDDMVLLVNKSHPLADKKEIDLRECRNESFINLSKSTNLQQFISEIYEDAGFVPDSIMECDYTLRDQMVIENYGVSITTKTSAENVDSDQVTALALTSPKKKRILGLVWHKNLVFTPAMKQFHDFACQYFDESGH